VQNMGGHIVHSICMTVAMHPHFQTCPQPTSFSTLAQPSTQHCLHLLSCQALYGQEVRLSPAPTLCINTWFTWCVCMCMALQAARPTPGWSTSWSS
jgi:hypothetical protein